MILIGNQMVYSWNFGIISLAFCPNPNNFARLKAREIMRIWAKRAWNHPPISLVTIWLHILILTYLKLISRYLGQLPASLRKQTSSLRHSSAPLILFLRSASNIYCSRKNQKWSCDISNSFRCHYVKTQTSRQVTNLPAESLRRGGAIG